MKFSPVFLFLLLLVIAPAISAQGPPGTQVVVNFDSGLSIDFPKIIFIEQNKDFTFAFHILNITTGLRVDNTSVNCTFELFDNRGNHQFENMNVTFEDNDWEILIFGGNFSRLGSYFYLTNCFSPGEGGAISQFFDVTADGLPPEPFPVQFSIILFALILLIFGVSIEKARIAKNIGSMILLIMGIITLFPGYGFMNWTTLSGLTLGTILIGIGFYFLVEDSFSRDEQETHFGQGGGEE